MSLEQIIKSEITDHGPVSLAYFMHQALSHPKYGYYKKKIPFGAKGDFITAPEISQVFGELIGIWCASLWMKMGSPKDINIVEIGPGKGTLMQDFIRGTKHIPGFHESVSINLVETSEYLQDIQKKSLKDKFSDIHWHKYLSSITKKPSIFIANELFDALPIYQFIKENNKWYEKQISLDNNNNLIFLKKLCTANDHIDNSHKSAADGSILEISPASIALLEHITDIIEEFNGGALIIDYGYDLYHYKNTLQSLYKHQYNNIFENIGDSDITAHVDFSAMVEVLDKRNVNNYGVVTQKYFLEAMGINIRKNKLLESSNNDQKKIIESEIDRLINPDQMGKLFKVLSFSNINLQL